MSSFTDKLAIKQVNKQVWRIIDGFKFHVGKFPSKEVISVVAGFLTDLQSIPGVAWSIIGHPVDGYAQAGAGHDFLYRFPADGFYRERTRKECDEIFLEMNEVLGCQWWKRSLKYSAVRVGGKTGWRNYRMYDNYKEGMSIHMCSMLYKMSEKKVQKIIAYVETYYSE